MKRELKANLCATDSAGVRAIAKLIPMKRELKVMRLVQILIFCFYRKADPDEKGTERRKSEQRWICVIWIAKLIPMKRELKVRPPQVQTIISATIAKLIPMKRELKAYNTNNIVCMCVSIAKLIPMKRELKAIAPSGESEPGIESQS